LVAVSCAALNSSTRQSLPHQKVLQSLNDLSFPECYPICAEQKTSCPRFACKSFVSKGFGSSVTQVKTFPWFDLTAAQLSVSLYPAALWCHLAPPHLASFGDWPTKQCGLISTKTYLTLAVMEPGVMLDVKSSVSTAASNMFSEIPKETTGCDSKSS
ncbi:NXRD1 protein, partial [Pedionomus torquatus]|nr:NXRD1 protein [Pedionomus torquatus]